MSELQAIPADRVTLRPITPSHMDTSRMLLVRLTQVAASLDQR